MSMGVELLSNNEVSSEYLKAEINKPRETKVPVLLSTKEISGSNKYYIKTEDLGKNEEREYELRVWIDYNADNTIEGKEFKGKLIIDGKIRTNSDLYIICVDFCGVREKRTAGAAVLSRFQEREER